MAKETPQEKHANLVEALRLQSEDSEYQSLAYEVERQTVKRKLRARKATASERAAALWAERVASARMVVNATSDERNTILDAETLMARAVGKATKAGELDAQQERKDSELMPVSDECRTVAAMVD